MEGLGYEYRTAEAEASHAYLFSVVSDLLQPVPQGAKVLDLGCGNGSFLTKFRDRGWHLFGSDFSPTGVKIAQEKYPDISFFVADASSPSGEILERVGQVDAIMSTEVIEHLYNPRGFLRNANSLLKPGGVIVLSTPYHGYLKNLFLAITGKMEKHFTVLWDHGHIKFWSKKTLTTVLEEAGFTQIVFRGAGRLPYLWKSIVVRAIKSA